jgi:hypothetical protein
MGRVPEHYRIEEALGIGIGELKLPVFPAVTGVINARLLARPGGHQERFVGGESYDCAEIQRARIRHLRWYPGRAAIRCTKISAMRAAGPRYLP